MSKSNSKRKLFYWIFKSLGVIIACAFPVWAIYERYPLWITTHGKSHSIGVGGILVAIVLLMIFKKSVFNFMRDRMKLQHAPPLAIWFVLLIISYMMMYVSKFLYDITVVFWMGLIGCGIGTLLTFIAEHKFGEKEKEEKSDEQ